VVKTNSLRNREQKNSIKKVQRESKCKNVVAFSFHYVTTNNKYSLDNLNEYTTVALVDKLKFMTRHGWLKLGSMGKSQGFELIASASVNIRPSELYLEKDSKLHVIRFNEQNYRLIGYRPNGCDVLHNIGIEYDFSLYKH
jgi:hypothetical protein